MSYKYIRFYLNNNFNIGADSIAHYNSILENRKQDGFIRASFDLNSSQKSISILCKSKKSLDDERHEWVKYLGDNEISITPKVEQEELKDKAHSFADCSHSHTCSHHHAHDHHHEHDEITEHHENHKLKAALGMSFGFCLLVLSLSSFNIPAFASFILNGLSALLALYLGKNLYQSAWHLTKNRQISTETLYSISTLTILGLSILSLLFPQIPIMLESAPLILGFWHLGEFIDHSLLAKINEKSDVRDCAPKSVRLRDNIENPVSVKTLIPNDIILVNKGDVIPVDGILNQPALLYTTRVDGSPYPKQFNVGDPVKAGMRLSDNVADLELRVTTPFKTSYLSLIAKNIDTAHQEKAPIEVFANKVLKYFVPGLIATSIISGIVIGLTMNYALAIQSVISILVSACPCALSLITPLAVRLGMKKSSENGVHFKNGKELQAAAHIDAVVFDLNGTLTEGKPFIKSLKITSNAFLKYFIALESYSDHPVSKTIMDYFEQQGIEIDPTVDVNNVDKSHHSGIKGIIQGQTFMIGNIDMLHSNGITDIAPEYIDDSYGTIYMVRGNEVIGQISISDRLRSDAIDTVQKLELLGKQIHICTGADQNTAEYYAKQLGVPEGNVCANTVGALTSPDEASKETYIKKLQLKGLKVAMVGDAANDLTAIARADVGVAVKSSIGDKLTEQHAGMAVHEGLLFPIVTAFDIAKKTKQNIYQNLFISLGYNALITLVGAGLFASIGLVLSPGIGVGCMVLESALVLANVYRLKLQKTITSPNQHIITSRLQEIHNEMASTARFATELRSRNEQTDTNVSVQAQSVAFGLNPHQPSETQCPQHAAKITTRINPINRRI